MMMISWTCGTTVISLIVTGNGCAVMNALHAGFSVIAKAMACTSGIMTAS